jgi:HxlR-like helix-turn-helix
MKRVKEDRLGMQRIDVGCARRAGLTIEILFQGKWKAQILCAMRSGPIRLGQLARIVPGASKKMLTQNLRKLEADGIVVRKDLTDLVLHQAGRQGERHLQEHRLAHLPPHLRHTAEGERRRREDGTGAFTARQQQDHTGCLYAGSGFQ